MDFLFVFGAAAALWGVLVLLVWGLYPSHLKTPAWERAEGRPAALQSLAGGVASASFCALQAIPPDAPPSSVSPSVKGIEKLEKPSGGRA